MEVDNCAGRRFAVDPLSSQSLALVLWLGTSCMLGAKLHWYWMLLCCLFSGQLVTSARVIAGQ